MSGGSRMRLIGRKAELAALDDAFSACRAASGGVILLTGPVGSGKTTLLNAFAGEVGRAGARLLWATGSPTEHAIPLGTLEQLLLDVDPGVIDVNYVTSLLTGGARHFLVNESDHFADHVRTVLSGDWKVALWKVLKNLTDDGPIVMCVDDAHFADPASVQTLSYLVRRLRSARILLVLAVRDQQDALSPPWLAELRGPAGSGVVRLPPLSLDDVVEVLRETAEPPVAERAAPVYHGVTGGSPLLLRSLLEDARFDDDAGSLFPGPTFGRAVAGCLHRHDGTTRYAARALAVLGEPAEPDQVRKLLGLDDAVVDQALRHLGAAGLVVSGRFRHEATRRAVLGDMLPEERAALHARVARLLHGEGAAPSAVAPHLLAGDRVHASWAPVVLREAAELALAAGNVLTAIRCTRRALELRPDDAERPLVVSTLARAEWLVDSFAVVRHLPELAGAVRDGRLGGRRGLEVVTYLLWHGRTEEAMSTCHTLLASGATTGEGPPGGTAQPGDVCCNYLRLLEDPPPGADGGRSDGGRPDVTVCAEQILRNFSIDNGAWVPVATALAALVRAGRVREAQRWCSRMLDRAATWCAPTWQAFFSAMLSLISYRRGQLAAAQRYAEAALTGLSPESWGAAIWLPIAGGLLAATARGRTAEAARYAETAIRPDLLGTPLAVLYFEARGRYHLAIGDMLAALADFQSCGRLMTTWGIDDPGISPWRSGAAQACLLLGRREEARHLALEQLGMAAHDRRTRAVTLRVAAATEPEPQRCRTLEEAVRLLEDCDDPLELATACADLSRALLAAGDSGSARVMSRRAHHAARRCGANTLRHSLEAEVEQAPAAAAGDERDSALAELSFAERRVATLAGEGHTNQQIASRLHVTTSTVEQHLTRTYRKLGVRGRTDLAARLRQLVDDAR